MPKASDSGLTELGVSFLVVFAALLGSAALFERLMGEHNLRCKKKQPY
jgi:hypothetical protein